MKNGAVVHNPSILGTSISDTMPRFRDINYGIILVGTYFLFDFGSFQGVFEIVNQLRLPFILALLSVIYAIYLVMNRQIDFREQTTINFLVLVLFIIIYSQLLTVDAPDRKALLTLFLQYLANYLIIVACVKKPSQFIFLIDVWLLAILHSSYHAIFQGGKLYDSIWLRDENHISLVVAMALPFAFVLLREHQSKIKKTLYLICILFYVAANVVAASRGGALSLIIAGLLCWSLYGQKLLNLFILLSITILVFSFAPQKYFNEMKTLEQGTEEGTADDRIYLWGFAIQMFKDHPVIGVGPMNYPAYFWSYEKGARYQAKRALRRVAHSTPIQWLAETGLVGSVILLMLQKSLYRNWRNRYFHNKINSNQSTASKDIRFLTNMSHSCAISQIAFWLGALFLTLINYPFYWCLPAFSVAWKNISLDYFTSLTDKS